MREFRMISAVLISKRNYKITLVRKGTIAKARSNFGFDPIYDLSVQRHIIVRKIDISRLRHQRKPKKQKENSEVHVREITSNGFDGKTLVCRSSYVTPFPFWRRACAAANVETQSLIWNSIVRLQLNARAKGGELQSFAT